MTDPATRREFTLDYDPGEIRFGRGAAGDLGDLLAARGLASALVMTGANVGANRDVMDPVEDGLGDSLAGVFDETTPAKTLGAALDAAERVQAEGIEAIVAVGSGSTLDAAKVASALGSYADPAAAAEHALSAGSVPVADDGQPTPVIAVPTTLAGADLSVIGGVGLTLDSDADPSEIPSGGVSSRRLMPTALCYDPELFETTPRSVLTASAMNGFDKAVECCYSPHATPITDGTASRGLALMRSGFAALPDSDPDPEQFDDAVAGVVCAQYGISTPGAYRASIIHAFGHGFSNDYDAHQGTVHGVLAPHVLRYVFSEVDGRRRLLATALGVDTAGMGDAELADAVVDAVAGVRDDLGLPTELRAIDGLGREHLPDIAETIHEDGLFAEAPVQPSVSEILEVLEGAW
ncbi:MULTISPECIES: iron-containing alcohol dehydrogenase family protein [Halolamina]|uniref:Alcohol dehydrogenase, class IV n=1 Tax=Halolamina pelagica TaxID=699431 RepID=A0A1I5UCT8_9EURY|nr:MULTISPECIES: iron-containing alcohol dehydrogenase family protein [Halolamina]NHX37231.1 iron-containing alcohol dehydrogenase [Halolamina sp. R1-12]SFP93100.1 Alcohol dehydrogenase, class IV [Halolamina pelagica]